MSRPIRIEFPGAYYHVMNRGRRSEEIFYDMADYITFLELLIKAINLWNVNIISYTLMPNHYHLLIHTPSGNLSRFMRHVNGVYTQRFNKNHETEGQLFKGRYKSILVERDSYLLQLVKYIHKNSVRAKLVSDINEFRWCSHHAYLSDKIRWRWVRKEFVLSMLAETKNRQKKEYLKFINEVDRDEIFKVFNKSKWPTVLGSEKFKTHLKEKFSKQKIDEEIPESFELLPETSIIKSTVCSYFQVKEEVLYISRRGYFNEPRNIALYLTRILRKDTLSMIGSSYNLKRYSSVSSIVNKMEKLMKEDKSIRKKVAHITGLICKGQT